MDFLSHMKERVNAIFKIIDGKSKVRKIQKDKYHILSHM